MCKLLMAYYHGSMTIQSVDMAEVNTATGRRCKTAPLRAALAKMVAGDAISVAYYNAATGEGYNPSTVAQVVGSFSRTSETTRFSVRRNLDKTSCYILCLNRED